MTLEQHEPQTELETLRQRVIDLEKQLATIRQRVRRHTIGLFDAVKQDDDPAPYTPPPNKRANPTLQ